MLIYEGKLDNPKNNSIYTEMLYVQKILSKN